MTRLVPLALLLPLAVSCAPREEPGVPRDGELPAAVRADLAAAERFEILATDPVALAVYGTDPAEVEAMHGYEVLRSAEITDVAQQREILDLVERGIHESDGTIAACFDPRHGIRAEREGRVSELLICYHCLAMIVYVDGERVGSATTTESPLARMNAIWAEHGCEVAGGE